MSMIPALHDLTPAYRPAMPVDAAIQSIASAAHRRGVVAAGTLREIPAIDLMRALRGAWNAVQGHAERTDRVRAIAQAIVLRLAVAGPVQVQPSSLGLLRSFAGLATAKNRSGK